MNQKRGRIFFIVLVIALLGLLSCQLIHFLPTSTPEPIFTLAFTPTLDEATPTATYVVGDLGWGSIYGKVTDANTGLPIIGAKVICVHFSYTSPAMCNTSTLTDKDGVFTFPNIFFHDTDRIQLEVSIQGYVTQTLHVDFLTTPWLQSDFALVAGSDSVTPIVACTAPVCGPYQALFCPSGDCAGGCGLICATPAAICTPPFCAIGTSEVYYCPGTCPGGCGTVCATYTPTP